MADLGTTHSCNASSGWQRHGRRAAALAALVSVIVGGTGACRRNKPPVTAAGMGGAQAGSGGTSAGGGQAGSSGAAGAGGGVMDTGAWKAVPGGEPCGLAVADVSKLGVPARTWSSCGDGCSIASALTLPSDAAAATRNASAAGTVGGEIYLRMTTGSPEYVLVVVTRLSDGKAIAAVKQTASFSSCAPVASQHAALAFPFILPSGAGLLVGLARASDGAVTWSPIQSNLPINIQVMSNDLGWAIQLSDGTVRVLMPPTDAQLRTIDRGVLATGQGGAVLDRMVWSTAVSGVDAEVIKGYTPAAGVLQLAAQDTDDHIVALSDTAVAWIGTTGPRRHEGSYETAQLFWAPWPDPLGPLSTRTGPLLPATNELSSLKTWGDFAATIGCRNALDTCELLVVKLSTGKLWRIPRRPGAVFLDVMAISPGELLVDEIDYPSGHVQEVQRLVRLDLTRLDALEHAW